jgi:hypothetical protein
MMFVTIFGINGLCACCQNLHVVCDIHRYEQQRENLANQSFNIEQQHFNIQGLKDTKATVSYSIVDTESGLFDGLSIQLV